MGGPGLFPNRHANIATRNSPLAVRPLTVAHSLRSARDGSVRAARTAW
jgi:hypothetical protein